MLPSAKVESGHSDQRFIRLTMIIYGIFFLSGLSGLIYESIWSHYLKLFLGHAAYAQTLVLIIFMGGMAIGAWLAARLSHRYPNLLLCYAVVEGVIGLLGIIFHQVFVASTHSAFEYVIPALGSSSLITVFKWSLGSLLILPQSILLGATFPLISAGVIRLTRENHGKTLATLYFTNSLGASIGVLFSGFYLIDKLGLPGTIMTAGVINIFLAIFVWQLVKSHNVRLHADENSHQGDKYIPVPAASTVQLLPDQKSAYQLLLLTAALTGLSSFIYEISWIRMLSMLLGASTHAFELMLSSFILGLAIGGSLIRNRIDKLVNAFSTLGYIQVLMGIAAVGTLVFYNSLFEWMSFIVKALQNNDQGYGLFTLYSHGFALLMMLPATIFAGMTLPVITHILLNTTKDEKTIGFVYAANTVGSIVGIIVSVHVLMPLLGLKSQLLIGCVVDIILAFWLFRQADLRDKSFMRKTAAICGLLLVSGIAIFVDINHQYGASGVFRHGLLREKTILFHRDGKTSTVDVTKSDSFLSIVTNGKPDASVELDIAKARGGDEFTMALLAVIPMSINPMIKDVAVIGMGSGITAHTLLSNPSLVAVDTIEIEPAMIEGARYFGERSENVFSDPRSHIYIDDAKTFFTKNNKKYDLIVSEPSNPWVSGVSGLFTEEFYKHISRHISENGMFAQWIHLYEMDDRLIGSVIAALSDNFKDFTVYQMNSADVLVLASNQTMKDPWSDVFSVPSILRETERLGIKNLDDLRIRKLGGKQIFSPAFLGYTSARNSDYFPILDQNATRARFKKTSAELLTRWRGIQFFMDDTSAIPQPTPYAINADTISSQQVLIANKMQDFLASVNYNDLFSENYYESMIVFDDEMSRFVEGVRFCRTADNAWVRSAIWVANNVTNFVSAEKSAEVWKNVSGFSCPDESAEKMKWVSLFSAIGVRNYGSIYAMTKSLLDDPSVVDPAIRRYLVFMNIASSVKRGDFVASYNTFLRYHPNLNELTVNERTLYNLSVHGINEAKHGRVYRL